MSLTAQILAETRGGHVTAAGELLHRANLARIEGMESSPNRYLVYFRSDADVAVEES